MTRERFNSLFGKYQAWGLSIIPITYKGKNPLVPWKKYQERRPQVGELAEWFYDDETTKNIGIVCGRVSGNLVVLDFDRKEVWDKWLKSWDEGKWGSIYDATPVVETGQGHHVYLRTKSPVSKTKANGIDIQGEGSCIVAPPSVHRSGKEYKFVNSDIDQILEIGNLSEVNIDLAIRPPSSPIDSKEDTIQQLAQLIEPFWTNGNRHDLALSLSAFLAKLGWASPMVKELINIISEGTSDTELKDRLQAVDDTFANHRANVPIRGFAGLQDIIPLTKLERIEELAKSVKVPPLIRTVDDIRLGDDKTFLKKRNIAMTVIESMKENGKFVRTVGNELFYLENDVIALDSPNCKAMLNRNYGLNPTEQEGKYTVAQLETEALSSDETVVVHRLAHWDRDSGCLYIDAGNGKVIKLNGNSIDTVTNKSSGVYFARDNWQLPFQPDFDNHLNPWEQLVNDLSFEVGELVALSPEQQKTVARLFIVGLFFPEELLVKPIFCITGDKGSGKSFFLRRLVKFLYGNGNVVELGDKDDFHASLSASHLLPLDDVEKDRTARWLIPELKRASTGQEIALRKLYETNTEVRFAPKCFIAFTSINPPIDDSAFADRLVILRLSPREKHSPESRMIRELLARRNRIWGGLLLELNQLIPKVKQAATDTRFRLADWASLAERTLGKDTMDNIIKGLSGFQNEALFGNSPIPSIIEEWSGDGRGAYLGTAELYEKWKTIAEEHKLWFPYSNPRSLGMHLENIKHNLKQSYGVDWRKGSQRKKLYRFPDRK